MSRRVVITGMGAVTPLANDAPGTWKAVLAGKSGIARTTHFDASFFPSQISGEVKNYDFTPWIKKDKRLERAMSNTRFALGASEEAIRDSGLDWPNLNHRRIGIYFAAGDGPANLSPFSRSVIRSFNGSDQYNPGGFVKSALPEADLVSDVEQEPHATLGHLVRMFEIEGPAMNCLTACAASAQAIGEGADLIRRGHADVLLSGGSHSMIHPFGVAGFCLLSTLSTSNDEPAKASRPFDLTRNGFVLSEGSAAVILEEYEHARRRGARIYAELCGYGSTADAYRLTDSHPEGAGAAAAIRIALETAGVNPSDVDYLNAHGTSTKVNDAVETLAIKKIFGDHAKRMPVSSTKSMTGHLIAAAGATELQFCLLAMRDGVVPPTINYKNPDPDCDLDYVPNEARKKSVRIAASNSFGFGGQNIVLVVKKP